jgi:hypothetical protein
MHYNIKGCFIKSENAAKSYKQQSLFLKNLIKSESKFGNILDYGCGKLRYSDILVDMSDRQVFVDSSVQLERIQIVHDNKSSVNRFIKMTYQNATTCSLESFSSLNLKFDFILCSNVLSAIPCEIERDKSVTRIKNSLSGNGKALFVCQYKDSYFELYRTRANCIEYLDGYIINNKNNYSFYGMITPNILENILVRNGMNIINVIDRKGSIYMYAN